MDYSSARHTLTTVTQSIQSNSFATLKQQLFISLVDQIANAQSVLEAQGGDVVLLLVPIVMNDDPWSSGAAHLKGAVHRCLCDLSVDGVITSFAPLEITSQAGDYVYVALRPKHSGPVAGSGEEI